MSLNKEEEYKIINNAISILVTLCPTTPSQVVDLLTGWLWDEEEAGGIKALQPTNAADAEPQSLENYLKSLPSAAKIY